MYIRTSSVLFLPILWGSGLLEEISRFTAHDAYLRIRIVYRTLETGLNTHSTHPTLAPTYNPALLSRTAALEADISFFLSVPTSSWQSHPLHRSLLDSFPSALLAYVTRLKDLSSSTDPSGLLAQAYVRYLGDLSGGQFIKRRIFKAYALDNEKATSSLDETPGTDFYKFGLGGGVVGAHPNGDGNTDGGRTVNMGALKKFKDWYRVGMDEGVGSDKEKKGQYCFCFVFTLPGFVLILHLFVPLKRSSLTKHYSLSSSTMGFSRSCNHHPLPPPLLRHLFKLLNNLLPQRLRNPKQILPSQQRPFSLSFSLLPSLTLLLSLVALLVQRDMRNGKIS